SFVFSRCSSWPMRLATTDGTVSSARAAAEKLPARTTATKVRMLSSVSKKPASPSAFVICENSLHEWGLFLERSMRHNPEQVEEVRTPRVRFDGSRPFPPQEETEPDDFSCRQRQPPARWNLANRRPRRHRLRRTPALAAASGPCALRHRLLARDLYHARDRPSRDERLSGDTAAEPPGPGCRQRRCRLAGEGPSRS